jgi:hypothetical protein
MKTWTLTITGSGRFTERTIIGAGQNTERARAQLWAAAAATIRHADSDERPRYTLQLGDQLAAIIQTGDDEFGRPTTRPPPSCSTPSSSRPRTPSTTRHPTSGRAPPAWPARTKGGALARDWPPQGGHRVECPLTFNRSAGRPV